LVRPPRRCPEKVLGFGDQFPVGAAGDLRKLGLEDPPLGFDLVGFAVPPVHVVGIARVIGNKVAEFDLALVMAGGAVTAG